MGSPTSSATSATYATWCALSTFVDGTPGETYNVCSGRGVTVRDVAEMMLSMSERPLELVVDPELVRPVDVPRLLAIRPDLPRRVGSRRSRSRDVARFVLDGGVPRRSG